MRRFLFAFLLFLSGCILMEDFDFPNLDRTEFGLGKEYFDHADYYTAKIHLEKAANQGDPDAQYMIGLMYLYGLGCERDLWNAQSYLQTAATAGHLWAQETLGRIYQDRYTPLYNPIDAYYWFSTAAKRNPGWYDAELNSLHANLAAKGLLEQLDAMPPIRDAYYKGVNYNSLFPYR